MNAYSLLKRSFVIIFILVSGGMSFSQGTCEKAVVDRTPNGDVILSEVFLISSNGNDSLYQWIELYNRGDDDIDLADYSIGSAGRCGRDLNYTHSVIQLSGKIKSHSFFVVGYKNGPSDTSNANPKFDLQVEFKRVFAYGNSKSADGIGLYHEKAKNVTKDSWPEDILIFSYSCDRSSNDCRLIDNEGNLAYIDVLQPSAGVSLERISDIPNKWRRQVCPNPGGILCPTKISLEPESPIIRLQAGVDTSEVIFKATVSDNGESGDSLRIDFKNCDTIPFIFDCNDTCAKCSTIPCTAVQSLKFQPDSKYGGEYQLTVQATYKREREFGEPPYSDRFTFSDKFTFSKTYTIKVIPFILREPPFTANLFNEVCWEPIPGAIDHQLKFFPPSNECKSKSKLFNNLNAINDSCDIIKNLCDDEKYGYYVKADLPENKIILSDTVYSTQDNSDPPVVILTDAVFSAADTTVTLTWTGSIEDTVSYIDRFEIIRQDLTDSVVVKTIAPRVATNVTPIIPLNYYPEIIQGDSIYYLDLKCKILNAPAKYWNFPWLRTAFRDRFSTQKDFIKFRIEDAAKVYVAYDSGAINPPEWLEEKEGFKRTEDEVEIENLPRKLKIRVKKFPAGLVELGGNLAAGADFGSNIPLMYAVILESLNPPKNASGQFTAIDKLDHTAIGRQFNYKVAAYDAAGNRSLGSELFIDLTPPCTPKITRWFAGDTSKIKFGIGLSNRVCVALTNCGGFAIADSLRYQAVRDNIKFFNLLTANDGSGKFLDSGWISADSACYTFSLLPAGEDLNFVDGHTYYYRVQAKDKYGNVSAWSDTNSAPQDVFAPSDIEDLTAEAHVDPTGTIPTIHLKWKPARDFVSGVEKYLICRSENENPDSVHFTALDTFFVDTVKEITSPIHLYYKIGSVDNAGHARMCEESQRQVIIRAPIGPEIEWDSTYIAACDSFVGTIKDTVAISIKSDRTDIESYLLFVNGPVSSMPTDTIANQGQVTLPVQLDQGNGKYCVRVRAYYPRVVYPEVTSTYSKELCINKTDSTAVPVHSLIAIHDPAPTGNIILSWCHSNPKTVAEYQIFAWPEGSEMPGKPDTVLSNPAKCDTLIYDFEKDSLNAYQCYNFKVRTVNCFGDFADSTISQYSDRPPEIDTSETEIGEDHITIHWNRPTPKLEKTEDFYAFVKVFEDSITPEPWKELQGLRKTTIPIEEDLKKRHNYIFFVKEKILDELGQACSNNFESNWSKPIIVPFHNPPLPVPFEIQALPVTPPVDSVASIGEVFLSWKGYPGDSLNVDSFLVRWGDENFNGSNAGSSTTDQDTISVTVKNIFQNYNFTVIAIDTLDQRSDSLQFAKSVHFKPPWLFTPRVEKFEPSCFKEEVDVNWGWLPDTSMFGAQHVEIEISIDSAFRFPIFKTDTVPAEQRYYTFSHASHYSWVNTIDSFLYARIRSIDKFGHVSPWSNEYDSLKSAPAQYDGKPPDDVVCSIDSVRAHPTKADGMVVKLIWDAATDNSCAGVKEYEVTRRIIDSTFTATAPQTFYRDTLLAKDLSTAIWEVRAVDNVGNKQKNASGCSLTKVLSPPDTEICVSNDSVGWDSVQSPIPGKKISYCVRLSAERNLITFAESLYCVNTTHFAIRNRGIEFKDSVFWQVKVTFDSLESKWSKVFKCGLSATEPVTDVTVSEMLIPKEYALEQNYPNPFNPETNIVYSIPDFERAGVHVLLEVYNVVGQKIRTLVNEEKNPGTYAVVWDGANDAGMMYGSGIYFYRLKAGHFIATRRMLLLK